MLIPTDPIWVDQDETLKSLCKKWRQQAAIAVDTEFMRSDTFYPIAGLIQVGDGQGCYLLDPLALKDLTPLAELMEDEKVTKIFHSCSEDLELFKCILNVVPAPLFDTQIAAAFAGFGFSIGYAGLAKEMLGVDIPKGETRSDWLQRPLSVAQLKYAALDVAHLLVVYGKLLQSLKAQERLAWVKSDCADLVAAAKKEDDASSYYKKVGTAWKLNARALEILKQLCTWREAQARLRDIPRNRVIKEPMLLDIAKYAPSNMDALKKIDAITKRIMDENGVDLIDIVNAARDKSNAEYPSSLPGPLAAEQRQLLKSLKKVSLNQAEMLSLPPEILARKKEYESIIRSGLNGGVYQLPERLNGWRYEVVGKDLLDSAMKF